MRSLNQSVDFYMPFQIKPEIVKFGINHPISKRKLTLSEDGDSVVLIQNGVFWAITDFIDGVKEKGVKVYALKDDFLAKGYREEDSKVPLISYDELIDILEKDKKVLG